jgi:excisionase family DNA binding protein
MPHTLFTVEEVAEYLHIPLPDVRRLVREKAIPHRLQGETPIFQQREIDAWATQRILQLEKKDLHTYHRASSARMHDLSREHAIIEELTLAECVEPELHSRTKPSLVRDMVGLAEKSDLVIYPEELLETLDRRERMAPTALPGGLALMHPEHHEPYMFEDSFIAIGRTIQPIIFGCPSGQTTDLFFLVCCQDDRIHLHVLARLCMMCQHTSLVLEMREAHDKVEMLECLAGAEREVIRTLG